MGRKTAPIIVTVLVVAFVSLYLIGLIFSLSFIPNPIAYFFVLLFIFGIIGVVIALIYNLIERLNEIKKEDNDDLSKY